MNEVIFFLGAGASVPAQVPAMHDFVDEFMQEVEDDQRSRECLQYVVGKLKNWQKSSRIDLEVLLAALEKIANRENEVLSAFYHGEDIELSKYYPCIQKLYEKLKGFICRKCIVEEGNIVYLEPLRDFIVEYGELDIFTLNYDLSIEQFSERYGLSYTDGFGVSWEPSLFQGNFQVKLYKIHGSITWYQTDKKKYIKVPIYHEPNLRLVTGELAQTLMVYPTHEKRTYTEPLSEIMQLLRKKLGQAKVCVLAGYSLRDEHIKGILLEASKKNKDLIFYFVGPSALLVYQREIQNYLPFYRVVFLNNGIEKVLANGYLYRCVQHLKDAGYLERKARFHKRRGEMEQAQRLFLECIKRYKEGRVLATAERILTNENLAEKNLFLGLEVFFLAGLDYYLAGEKIQAARCFKNLKNLVRKGQKLEKKIFAHLKELVEDLPDNQFILNKLADVLAPLFLEREEEDLLTFCSNLESNCLSL